MITIFNQTQKQIAINRIKAMGGEVLRIDEGNHFFAKIKGKTYDCAQFLGENFYTLYQDNGDIGNKIIHQFK